MTRRHLAGRFPHFSDANAPAQPRSFCFFSNRPSAQNSFPIVCSTLLRLDAESDAVWAVAFERRDGVVAPYTLSPIHSPSRDPFVIAGENNTHPILSIDMSGHVNDIRKALYHPSVVPPLLVMKSIQERTTTHPPRIIANIGASVPNPIARLTMHRPSSIVGTFKAIGPCMRVT